MARADSRTREPLGGGDSGGGGSDRLTSRTNCLRDLQWRLAHDGTMSPYSHHGNLELHFPVFFLKQINC